MLSSSGRRSGLSKSRIALFEQCPKRLWLAVHRPELAEETIATAVDFRVGHDVGALACSLYPDGHMISGEHGLAAAVAETADLLARGWNRPLFEATFAHDDVLVRVDLLLPRTAGWHVAEVKSTTGLKPYHLADLAIQLWVVRGTGLDVAAATIRHLDRRFVLRADGAYDGLFADTPVDDLVEPLIATRAAIVAQARATLARDEPIREPGAHCDDPFACSFKRYCRRGLPPPPDWPVALLPDATGKTLAAHWQRRGIDDLTLVPASAMPSDRLRQIHEATLTGIAHHDVAAFREETAGWAYPRTFLDFETVQFAIPRWIGTRPYEQVPFQFSGHVEDRHGSIAHHPFLALDGHDPRRGCALALAALPPSGAVIAWNAAFERRCLLGLADLFPDLAPALASLANRLVDLLPPVRRHYYHRDQRGSWSLKAVVPTLAPDLGYEALTGVQSGIEAQAAFIEATAPDTSTERRATLEAGLLAYCDRDTWAMKIILDRLQTDVGAPHLP